ncbi:LolA family protein [Ruania zhangjianzhongii]|uniref:LolA family protein n=1 Tax=Ruania zhangjianzhongii TaxID=2603206 RepID=UPI0011CC3920|nr:DUF2092 domain-containing protein [Ruania zhangjianzhongii]
MARTWTRWLPAAAVPLVVAGSFAVATTTAGADELPERSPEDVLTLLAGHEHQPLSGEFTQTSDLGLPELPADVPGTDGDAAAVLDGLELITSDHTGRVFVGDQDQARIQLFDSFGEQNAIVNGSDAWFYDSADNSATHVTAPEGEHSDQARGAQQLTPEALAEQVVAAADPSTELSVRGNVEVAGRTAYDLVLTPRTDSTLVGEVSIAVDGETGLPLRVSITASGADSPAVEVAYTELDLSPPDADLFDFTPPADATVEEVDPQGHDGQHGADSSQPRPQATGTGWETVLAAPAGTLDLSTQPILTQLTSAVDGGRVLTTDLLTVLITDDGRVLAGAVPLERLQAAA